jgi:D-alanyl-D-alanine carboxypeptidase (penicillin-binding protein 5/6)
MQIKMSFAGKRHIIPLIILALLIGGAATMDSARGGSSPESVNPMVLGETTAPLTVRGQPAAATDPIPVPTSTLSFTQVKAKSFLAYDAKTQTILAEKNSHAKMAVASLTKLLTALVVYEQTRLNDIVTIRTGGLVAESPVLGLRPGDRVTVEDLFNSMLVGSANDAASMLADYIQTQTGTAFPILMNAKARELGMSESNFSNPLGFDSAGNYSTAHDLALLTNATRAYSAFDLHSKSLQYQFTSLDGNHYQVRATNQLTARDQELSAVKTGFTTEANGDMITSATRDGNEIIIIVLNSDDREGDTLLLKNEIFSAYRWK